MRASRLRRRHIRANVRVSIVRMPARFSLALALALGAVVVAATATAAFAPAPTLVRAQSAPAFEVADCAALLVPETDNPLNALLPAPDEHMRCGYVSVPESHASADGRTLRLAVVVLEATGDARKADPLFMLQGGPGGGTIDTYQILMRNQTIRAQHDIVLFDQRGTGKSQPALKCHESYDAAVRNAEIRLSPEEEQRIYETAVAQCHTRLIEEGIRLNAFNSFENARDIDDVRIALGYEKINLYGVSYGTQLAQHAMREIPAALRSVILDGVVRLPGSFVIDAAHSENRAVTEFFSACAADATCARDYPHLEQTFYDLVTQLDQRPLRMRVDDPNTGNTHSMFLDGLTLQGMLFQSLYSSEIIPLLPRMIYDLQAGNTGLAGNVASLFAFDDSVAQGMYLSIICAEDANFDPHQVSAPDLRPQIAAAAVKDAQSLLDSCRTWNVEALPAVANEPVSSTIPTLLLNGRFDPITPPSNGIAVASTLGASYVFTFPTSAHGAFPMNDCANGITQAFIARPDQQPDGTCIDPGASIAFVGKNSLIPVPVVGQMLNAPSTARQRQFLALAAAMLVLLSGIVLMPLGWLTRLLLGRRSSRPMPFAARVMPWAAALYTFGIIVFVGGIFGAAIAAIAGNDYSFLGGVTSDILPLFSLLPVLAILTGVILWGVVAGWRSGTWGILRRLYRSALALAAIVASIVLVVWGMFNAL